jgi:hypothetical protein
MDHPGTDFPVLRDAYTAPNAVPQIALVPDAGTRGLKLFPAWRNLDPSVI